MQPRKKVVILGGGTGTSFVLRGLKYFPVEITAVITVSDDGSSTGRLRWRSCVPETPCAAWCSTGESGISAW